MRPAIPRQQRYSPKQKRKTCHLCGKVCSSKGIYEHMRHHCPRNSKRTPRVFGRIACPICGKNYNAHYMRVHMATQHAGKKAPIGRPRSREKSARTTHDKISQPQRPHKIIKSSPPPQIAPKERSRSATRNQTLSDDEARRLRVFKRMAQFRLEPMAPARAKPKT